MQPDSSAIAHAEGPRPTLAIAAAGIPLLVLAAHAYHYLPFISDDALISLRYADRLLDGHGLTWTGSERVEGYSNLLWILCVALLGSIGLDLIDAARILGFAGMGAAVLAAGALYRPRDEATTTATLGAGLSMALTGSFAIWTIGGLEQPLLIGLVAWATVKCIGIHERGVLSPGEAVAPGVLLGLACWTRPDSPIFVIVLAGLLACTGGLTRRRVRVAGTMAGVALAFFLAQLAFRLLYYGDWLPNSARAKLALSAARLESGLDYLGGGLLPLAGLLIPALLAVALPGHASTGRRRVVWLLVPAASWALYVVVVGGDIFPGRRHLGVLIVFLALLSSEFFLRVRPRSLAIVSLSASLCLLGWAQWKHDPDHLRATEETWEWDGEVIGTLLRRAFDSEQPLVAVNAAGCIPYFSGLPSLDMLGLNDRYLATHPPADLGEGSPGHELGDGAYVLSREPDLVILCSPAGSKRACFRSGEQMLAIPEFRQRYRLVPFLGTEPHPFRSLVWVRIESERIGLKRTPTATSIPGFLLTPRGRAAATLDAQGRIGMQVAGARPSLRGQVDLDPGRWSFRVTGTGRFHVTLRRGEVTLAESTHESAGHFTLAPDESSKVEIVIEGAAHLRRVTFERL